MRNFFSSCRFPELRVLCFLASCVTALTSSSNRALAQERASQDSLEMAEQPMKEREVERQSANEPAKLQKPFARQGQFLALGTYFTGIKADDADRGPRALSLGPAFSLRLGQALVKWADIGIQFDLGLGMTAGDDALTTFQVMAHTRLYPHERLFVHAGLGFGYAQGLDPKYPDFDRVRYGDVYTLGLGSNVFLRGRNRSGGPILSPVVLASLGPDKEFLTLQFWAGLEIAWFGGLRRDQLDLPMGEAYGE